MTSENSKPRPQKAAAVSIDNDPLLTGADVAAILGVQRRSLRRMRLSGRLPYIRLGHTRVRYLRSDVAAFIASLRRTGGD